MSLGGRGWIGTSPGEETNNAAVATGSLRGRATNSWSWTGTQKEQLEAEAQEPP